MARSRKPRRRKKFKISISALGTFLSCPAQYFFNYYSGAPKHTDYPRYCGIKVHNFIKKLEVGTKKYPRSQWSGPRRFFYKNLQAAVKAWKREWILTVERATNNGYLINPNEVDTFKFMNIGVTCITNYWTSMEQLLVPLEVESSYEYPWGNTGVPLVGHLDQVRTVKMSYIKARRPELIDRNGELDPRFAPVMIVDFKTGWSSYDPTQNKKEPTLEEQMRTQYPLHYGIQATAYSWLYFTHTGKWPIGFWWNHLRTGKVFLTHRDNFPEDGGSLGKKYLRELNAVIEHIIDCEHALSFPKHVNNHCKSCDFIVPCLGTKEFHISPAETVSGEAIDEKILETLFSKYKDPQQRFKLKIQRAKKTTLAFEEIENSVTITRDLPWREEDWEEATEELLEEEIEELDI